MALKCGHMGVFLLPWTDLPPQFSSLGCKVERAKDAECMDEEISLKEGEERVEQAALAFFQ